MKLFGYELTLRKTVTEKFKAEVTKDVGGGKPSRKTFYPGQHSWLSRCQHYDKVYDEYPLFRQGVIALAGLVMSQGVFLRSAVNKQDETYGLAEEAVYQIKKAMFHKNTNSKMYQTVWNIGKYGGCFWEITDQPVFDWRVPPLQEYIEPYRTDDEGNVVEWKQIVQGMEKAHWKTNSDGYSDLVLVNWNVTSETWPYGSSLALGCETELEALVDFETNAKDYMDKQAWPYEILQLGNENSSVLETDYTSAKSAWQNRKPGQGITTRNMPVNIVPGGTGSAPIRELAALCQLMKDNVHDGIMMPPLSKLYNSTEASAKVMTQHVMTVLGQPIQWVLKEMYEEYVLKRWLENHSFSRKSCPQVLFESPDVHKTEEGEYWALLVERGIQTPQQACEHLGLEYDEEYWVEQERKQQEQMNQQQNEEEGEEVVYETRVKRGASRRGRSKDKAGA